MSAVRLIDIARMLGVSHTAVSKVLNGQPIRIGEDKRKQICELASELGYKPNIIARSLQNRTSKSIGVVVPDISTLFYPSLIMKIETTLSSCGYQTIICDTANDPAIESRHIEDLASRLVDGFIVAPASDGANVELFSRIHGGGRPLVFIDRYLPGSEFHYVVSDNMKSAAEGVKMLAKRGVKRLFYLGERTRNRPLDDRLEGARQEASRRGVDFPEGATLFCEVSREAAKKAFRSLFKDLPGNSGLLLESNRYLMGVLDAARERGLTVPSDLEIIGFDDFAPSVRTIDDIASLGVLKSPVPIIEQDMAGISRLACEYLLSVLDGKVSKRKFQVKLPAKISLLGD